MQCIAEVEYICTLRYVIEIDQTHLYYPTEFDANCDKLVKTEAFSVKRSASPHRHKEHIRKVNDE